MLDSVTRFIYINLGKDFEGVLTVLVETYGQPLPEGWSLIYPKCFFLADVRFFLNSTGIRFQDECVDFSLKSREMRCRVLELLAGACGDKYTIIVPTVLLSREVFLPPGFWQDDASLERGYKYYFDHSFVERIAEEGHGVAQTLHWLEQ